MPRALWILLSLFAIFNDVGGALHEYKPGDKVDVYVNKVGPYANIHETYHYYSLPLCRPENIVHKSLSLGQVLDGDRIAESAFQIKFGESQATQSLCGDTHLDMKDSHRLLEAIEENYYFEQVVDDIKVRNFIGYVEETKVFPHEHTVYVYTEYKFNIVSNQKHILSATLDMYRPQEIQHGKEISLNLGYSVTWNMTNIPDNARSREGQPLFTTRNLQIHWLAVLNSALLTVLLVLFAALIVCSSVRRDLSKYNGVDDIEDDMMLLDNGWKTISMDVFRHPPSPMLLSGILGVGTQFLVIFAAILFIGSFNVMNVHRHGLLNTLSVVLYSLTSGVAGYVSSSRYRQLEGQRWITNIYLTSFLFAGPMIASWTLSNTVAWAYGSTQALPWTTVLVVLSIWLLFGFPLTILGGVLGRSVTGKYSAPCRTRAIPRELPRLTILYSTPSYMAIGGFLSFSAICVELYYIFSTIWGRESYTLFYMIFIVFVLLVTVVACVSIAITYFQLNAEDYRWWWRSVFNGGAVGLFIFLYGCYFLLAQTEMSGAVQLTEFFTTLALISYVSFLSAGTVSHYAAHWFVRYLYSNVKTD